MKSLKEFKYFDPKTRQPIADPNTKLTFDKNGIPTWRTKKGQLAKNPGLWVGAETKGEQVNLGKFSGSSKLSLDQVLTTAQVNALERAAKDKAAAAAKDKADAEAKSKAEAEAKEKEAARTKLKADAEAKKKKEEEEKAKAAEKASQDVKVVVKNLSDSGTLQTEVTKAVVNSNDIPIFTEDFGKIRKAINTLLSKAIKSKLFTHEYTVGEGVAVENGEANAKPAREIAEELIKKYLTSSKNQDGKTIFSYSILPAATEVSESLAVKDARLFEDTPAPQASGKPETPAGEQSAAPAEQAPKATPAPAPAEQPPQNAANPAPENKETPPAEQPSSPNVIALSESSKENLTSELAEAIEPLLSEISKTITSSAKTVKYHCSTLATPDQENNSSQAVEQKAESKDRRIFQRLLEEEEPSGEGEEVSEEATPQGVPAEEGKEEIVTEKNKEEAPAEDIKEGPSEVASKEAIAFPNNDTLKTLVDGLNKSGKSFETPNATYNLSYSIDSIDPKDKSFDVIVTSSSTTPKDGFWTWFGNYLKKAGAQIVSYLAGERGHMDI